VALAFEKPIEDLEVKVREMRTYATEQQVDLGEEIALLEQRLERLKRETFEHLTRWQRVQVARAPGRPTALDHVAGLVEGFVELHGDRALGDDPALVAGLGRIGGHGAIVLAQQKGRDTKENIFRNFGMAHPSGYRKAMRMMDLADKFGLPVVALIDTPGAYPGIAAEEQGQAWVIAESIRRMSRLRVPAVAVVVGEGGSGGALAVGVANRVLILENAVYSVISPESCAAIRWRDAAEAPRAAEALKLTAATCSSRAWSTRSCASRSAGPTRTRPLPSPRPRRPCGRPWPSSANSAPRNCWTSGPALPSDGARARSERLTQGFEAPRRTARGAEHGRAGHQHVGPGRAARAALATSIPPSTWSRQPGRRASIQRRTVRSRSSLPPGSLAPEARDRPT
jgi:acetyl-CoA carboxylase carboxyl transferase subunit alpha